MKFYECISKILAKGINIVYVTPEDNATFLKMVFDGGNHENIQN